MPANEGLHTGTEKAAAGGRRWRRGEFCWEEEPVLAVSGVRLELPEGIPGLRRLERWCPPPGGGRGRPAGSGSSIPGPARPPGRPGRSPTPSGRGRHPSPAS
ncbi:MAG: hypothetical protein ACLRWQ_02375 [Flavonifractor plautii]